MAIREGNTADISDRVGGADVEHIFEPAYSSLMHFRAGWDTKCPTAFRIIPAFKDSTPQPGFFERDGELKVGNWLIKLPVIWFAGSAEKQSIIAYDPYEEADGDYDKHDNPYLVARDKLWRASGDKNTSYKGTPTAAWRILLDGRDAIMGNVKMRCFLQAGIYMHSNGSLFTGGEHKRGAPFGLQKGQNNLPILSASAGAGNALVAQGMKLWKEEGIDITSLDFQSLIMFANEEKHNRAAFETVPGQSAPAMTDDEDDLMANASEVADVGGASNFGKEYVVWIVERPRIPAAPRDKERDRNDREPYLDTSKKGVKLGPLSLMKEEILARKSNLFKVFHVPDTEELCVRMARMFSDKPFLLEFGWRERPEFMTAEVKAILAKRKAVATAARELSDEPGSGGGLALGDDSELLDDSDLLLAAENAGVDGLDDEDPESFFSDEEPEPTPPPAKGTGKKIAAAAAEAAKKAAAKKPTK